jgi:hypothetical protein
LVAVTVVGAMAPTSAARTRRTSVPTGNDISYPQCGGTLPTGQAFGIAGVNGGLANNANPCLGRYQGGSVATSELYWAAATSRGTTTQPKASLYVNTADPGNVYNGKPIADWPQSGTTPYGNCTTTVVTTSTGVAIVGMNSTACAYEYGRERATQDAQTFFANAAKDVNTSRPGSVSTNPADYPWWLDVESVNTWQQGSSGQQMNVAALRGMVEYFGTLVGSSSRAPSVGVYATSADWQAITGGTGPSSPVYGLPLWIPGATSKSGAQSNCKATSYTGGPIRLTQWDSTYDNDYAC